MDNFCSPYEFSTELNMNDMNDMNDMCSYNTNDINDGGNWTELIWNFFRLYGYFHITMTIFRLVRYCGTILFRWIRYQFWYIWIVLISIWGRPEDE